MPSVLNDASLKNTPCARSTETVPVKGARNVSVKESYQRYYAKAIGTIQGFLREGILAQRIKNVKIRKFPARDEIGREAVNHKIHG